jgi:hypothetical protein
LREEHRLKVFKNRVLKKILEPKKDEVRGDWRKLHKEELYDLYSSPNTILMIKSRRMSWTGQVARMVDRRGAYKGWVRKPEGKRPLGKPKHKSENNIKMNLQEVGW